LNYITRHYYTHRHTILTNNRTTVLQSLYSLTSSSVKQGVALTAS